MKFPLMLSCGHMASSSCDCRSEPKYNNTGDSPIDIALRDYSGQWRQTLEGYGCVLPHNNKHGACPVCGGKDRFRFDDKQGRGTWFCSQCDVQSGGGLLLLSRYLGKTTVETAKELIGDDMPRTVAPKRAPQIIDYDAIKAAEHEQAKKAAKLFIDTAATMAHQYTDNKGLSGEYLTNGQPLYSRDGVLPVGSLLLVPAYINGELVNVQKITAEGVKRPLTGGDMSGCYNKIDGKPGLIGIVEGYATGLTVSKMTGAIVYCAFQTANLSSVAKYAREHHPDSRIVMFADHDELDPKHNWRPGTKYAEAAAIPINALVALPPELGDWDDYRQKHGVELCKQAMRDAINADLARMQPVPVPTEPVPVIKPKPIIIDKTPRHGLPHGINFDNCDIDKPPGLAGQIVDYIEAGSSRLLRGGAYSVVALQCMAAAGAGLEGVNGTKMSLISVTLGLTAAGKERPQKVAKELMKSNGRSIYGDIRSDKDILRSVINDNGRSFYIVDEAQKIFGAASKGNKHMGNVESALMEIATSSEFLLSPLHREEFSASLELKQARVEKMIAAKVAELEMCNPDLDEAKMKIIDLKIEELKKQVAEMAKRMDAINNGIPNPSLNLICSSTPQKLAEIVSEDTIESGFLGRAIIVDCGSERARTTESKDVFTIGKLESKSVSPTLIMLQAQIGLICQLADDFTHGEVQASFGSGEFGYDATPEAVEALTAITRHYEQYHFLNHARLGGLYARLKERVWSLSSVMALGNVINGKATIERDYVVYALMITLNSIECLASNLRVNEGATENTMEAKLEAVKEAILKRLKVDKNDDLSGWRYKSDVKNQLKRRKFFQTIQAECLKDSQDAFENAIAMLGGVIENSQDRKQIRIKR